MEKTLIFEKPLSYTYLNRNLSVDGGNETIVKKFCKGTHPEDHLFEVSVYVGNVRARVTLNFVGNGRITINYSASSEIPQYIRKKVPMSARYLDIKKEYYEKVLNDPNKHCYLPNQDKNVKVRLYGIDTNTFQIELVGKDIVTQVDIEKFSTALQQHCLKNGTDKSTASTPVKQKQEASKEQKKSIGLYSGFSDKYNTCSFLKDKDVAKKQ